MPPTNEPSMILHGRFAHYTDLHANPRRRAYIPQGRSDTYHEDCWFEMEAFRRDCLERGVQAVLFSGDFFNLKDSGHYRPSDLHFFSDWIVSFGIPWYGIPGNHDLPQASMVNYEVSALRALEKMTPNMHNVMGYVAMETMGTPACPFAAAISGAPYAKLEETFEVGLPALDARLAGAAGYRIALVHTDMMPPGSKALPGHWNVASYDDVLDSLPSVHLVCGGHIHNGSIVYTRADPFTPGKEQRVSKPFAAGRNIKDYFATVADLKLQHVPTWTEISFRALTDAEGVIVGPILVDTEEREIDHIPFERAFVQDSLGQLLAREAKLTQFVAGLREEMVNRQQDDSEGKDLVNPDQVLLAMTLDAETRAMIDEYRRRRLPADN